MADASDFIGYIGNPDFHDGSVIAVQQGGNTACVLVRGASGRIYTVEFQDVSKVKANHPEGLLLYALAEMTTLPPCRRFIFANWEDQDDAYLEVFARECRVSTLSDKPEE